MALKDYKRIVNQKDNIWYQVGVNKENPKYLTKRWVHISKDSYSGEWQVHAPTRINPKTVDGHYKFFKTKSGAMKFAKLYMKSH